MIDGYARVSTVAQSVGGQVRELTKAAGCKKVFREVASGARGDRSQLRRALDRLDAACWCARSHAATTSTTVRFRGSRELPTWQRYWECLSRHRHLWLNMHVYRRMGVATDFWDRSSNWLCHSRRIGSGICRHSLGSYGGWRSCISGERNGNPAPMGFPAVRHSDVANCVWRKRKQPKQHAEQQKTNDLGGSG